MFKDKLNIFRGKCVEVKNKETQIESYSGGDLITELKGIRKQAEDDLSNRSKESNNTVIQAYQQAELNARKVYNMVVAMLKKQAESANGQNLQVSIPCKVWIHYPAEIVKRLNIKTDNKRQEEYLRRIIFLGTSFGLTDFLSKDEILPEDTPFSLIEFIDICKENGLKANWPSGNYYDHHWITVTARIYNRKPSKAKKHSLSF